MNDHDMIVFAVGVVVGIVLVLLYNRMKKSEQNKEEPEQKTEQKENFGTLRYCDSKCMKSGWDDLKTLCGNYQGKYEKCGDKNFWKTDRVGRRCVDYRADQNYYTGATSCADIDGEQIKIRL